MKYKIQNKRAALILFFDKYSCKLINIIRRIKYYLFNREKKLLKKNVNLKLHNNENNTCFVFGNGSSLRQLDFQAVRNIPSFSVNYFFKGVGSNYSSTYHIEIDPGMGTSEKAVEYNRISMQEHMNTKFIFGMSVYNMLKDKNFMQANSSRVYCIQNNLVEAGNNIQCNLCSQVTGSQNVVCVALECAMYMGYKEIYLLGCDMTDTGWEHFYTDKDANTKVNEITEMVLEDRICKMLAHKHHFAIAGYAKKHGIKIYNLSDISTVSAYEKKTLEEVLKCL